MRRKKMALKKLIRRRRRGKYIVTGWAVFHRDKLALIQAELPIYWVKKVAKNVLRDRLRGNGFIMRVDISEST